MASGSNEPTPEIRDHAWEFRTDSEAAEIDDTLWWTVGRRSMLTNLLELAAAQRTIKTIVEIGCGSGGDLALLSRYGKVTGVERSKQLAGRARNRGIAEEIIEVDFFDLSAREPADLYCLFDVLEHIEDDGEFIDRLARQAGPGHLLLLSVPACPSLYSQHDAILHHYRRYSGRQLVSLLEANGYEVIRSTYFVLLLLPMVAISRLQEKLLSAIGRAPREIRTGEVPGWLNTLLTGVLHFEAWIARFIRLPIGVWFFVLARRARAS